VLAALAWTALSLGVAAVWCVLSWMVRRDEAWPPSSRPDRADVPRPRASVDQPSQRV